MIVDIQNHPQRSLITFKARDFTGFKDILQIVSAIASGRYSFEPTALLSEEFEEFINNIKPRNSYGIVIGIDHQNVPCVDWGRVKNQPSKTDSAHKLYLS